MEESSNGNVGATNPATKRRLASHKPRILEIKSEGAVQNTSSPFASGKVFGTAIGGAGAGSGAAAQAKSAVQQNQHYFQQQQHQPQSKFGGSTGMNFATGPASAASNQAPPWRKQPPPPVAPKANPVVAQAYQQRQVLVEQQQVVTSAPPPPLNLLPQHNQAFPQAQPVEYQNAFQPEAFVSMETSFQSPTVAQDAALISQHQPRNQMSPDKPLNSNGPVSADPTPMLCQNGTGDATPTSKIPIVAAIKSVVQDYQTSAATEQLVGKLPQQSSVEQEKPTQPIAEVIDPVPVSGAGDEPYSKPKQQPVIEAPTKPQIQMDKSPPTKPMQEFEMASQVKATPATLLESIPVPTQEPVDMVNAEELFAKKPVGIKVGDLTLPGYKGEGAKPIILQSTEEAHSFVLDDGALESILLRPEVADKKVAVIAVAGAFRKGKSFLLNFFLRCLTKNATNKQELWLGDESEYIQGFSWRGGSERDTSGILVWKDPFVLKLSSGEEIAVILMDTQGAFDSQSTVKDCATVFALSTMISSLQIFNLSQNIQEDDLQHLQLFTEYGRLAIEEFSDAKPFQSLLFLVRDWSFPYEAEYGFSGGERILDRRLEVSERQHVELQQLRKHIRSCFERIECFLMPHPGLQVATSPKFTGKLADIESEFKVFVQRLVNNVLDPQKLILKEINGNKVTCRELMEYFRAYIKIFQGEELPEPKSMLMATAEANNLAAVTSCKALYSKCMDEICGGDTPYLHQADLDHFHIKYREHALQSFVDTRKMGGEEFSRQFVEKLDEEISEAFESYVKVNNSKNLFKSVKTPTVLFCILIAVYVAKEIFEFIYLGFIAQILSSIVMVLIVTISMWGYARYSGNFREFGTTVDDLTSFIFDEILHPLSHVVMAQGVARLQEYHGFSSAPSSARSVVGRQSSTASEMTRSFSRGNSTQSSARSVKNK